MDNIEIRKLIRTILQEEFKNVEIDEISGHQTKKLIRLLDWSEKFLHTTIKNTKSGFLICPVTNLSTQCYATHRTDSGIYDIMRFLAKTYGVTKQEIENAYNQWVGIKTLS